MPLQMQLPAISVALFGERETGKTTFLDLLTHKPYHEEYEETTEKVNQIVSFSYSKYTVDISFTELPSLVFLSHSANRTIDLSNKGKIHIFFVSNDSEDSLHFFEFFTMSDTYRICDKDMLFLVLNKTDLPNAFQKDDLLQLCKERDANFLEISLKNGGQEQAQILMEKIVETVFTLEQQCSPLFTQINRESQKLDGKKEKKEKSKKGKKEKKEKKWKEKHGHLCKKSHKPKCVIV
ncbi:hypothetical protein EIN_400490 [Entamoeba invadens IP1]|uniref:Uncharacterized protein n=1 Tax=Entamoeba invadens IP1 TaxID=370355 RepID=A0A0A1UFV4_ENTIV|nr:hypothetical protein EIN_400490 [Entamoeba invadens IP1]ELP91949.1 hypothetical protein EIN_400490 [Entamoeba invadens IP1]|eukprot:XP_004258720.1 hypothetical protein EIN_400490 [Entamoeba invadens IP1]